MQYKLRSIVNQKSTSKMSARKVFGLTVPDVVAVFFEGCLFTVERSGTCIICHSGASLIPTKKEVTSYHYEDVKV